MVLQPAVEKWSGKIAEVAIGNAGPAGIIKVGGQETLPFLFSEGKIPNAPFAAFEIWDVNPADWPQELKTAWGESLKDPFAWAEACVNKYKAQALCLRLAGSHPDYGNRSAADEAKLASGLAQKFGLPMIVIGSGDKEKDNAVLPAVSEALKGRQCLIGCATQDNYKTLTAACLADGHSIIAESPIDINIAKQLNILISDMGLPLERIVIDPTTGALGYGLEYAYSIMERARLAALSGDKTVASPFICFVGLEAWKAKEAKVSLEQGIIWEAMTAAALLQAGADILVMRHPAAIEKVKKHIENLMGK
ncbi:MAG: acetyl-CoA decarbonylase/synthase complex subunit delta [Candidatus Omnitrophota bacterium]|nr:acetyl-CoA decarbonylase/synthase complex subunit delta [Candidatus Omnitrophota bacterium]